ncbi:hypothetical protein UPYG_G00022890 [Umbra pygmaea]|uniref:Ig-like domain-containing protein n=1 Tax=Umbra pygmaea TaxID=75934 RepID=A0ABD0XLA7_UMBPY
MSITLLTFLLLEAIVCSVLGQQLYKAGDSLVLTPNKADVPGKITAVLWRIGNDKVAEWDMDFKLDIYGNYKDRTDLNQTTGVLTINDSSIQDSGVYSVEFNSKVLEKKFTLSVIKAVPNPQITYSCNSDKTLCTLICGGDTTDAGTVTYHWKKGEDAFKQSDKQLNVTKTDDSKTNYTCQLKNAVSSATGVFDEDLFSPDVWLTNARLLGFSVFFVAIVIVVLFTVVHRAITGVWFYQKESMPWEGDFWKREREGVPNTDGLNGVSYSACSADNGPDNIEEPEGTKG